MSTDILSSTSSSPTLTPLPIPPVTPSITPCSFLQENKCFMECLAHEHIPYLVFIGDDEHTPTLPTIQPPNAYIHKREIHIIGEMSSFLKDNLDGFDYIGIFQSEKYIRTCYQLWAVDQIRENMDEYKYSQAELTLLMPMVDRISTIDPLAVQLYNSVLQPFMSHLTTQWFNKVDLKESSLPFLLEVVWATYYVRTIATVLVQQFPTLYREYDFEVTNSAARRYSGNWTNMHSIVYYTSNPCLANNHDMLTLCNTLPITFTEKPAPYLSYFIPIDTEKAEKELITKQQKLTKELTDNHELLPLSTLSPHTSFLSFQYSNVKMSILPLLQVEKASKKRKGGPISTSEEPSIQT